MSETKITDPAARAGKPNFPRAYGIIDSLMEIVGGQQEIGQVETYNMARLNWDDRAILRMSLNDEMEFAISQILREDPVISKQIQKWAKAMAVGVPSAYNTYNELLKYIHDNLASQAVDVHLAPKTPISHSFGSEADFVKDVLGNYKTAEVENYNYANKKPDLSLIEKRKEIIGAFRKFDFANEKNIHNKTASLLMAKAYKDLVFKLYYTYKLWDVVERAAGYYNGSLEFRAGKADDYEYYSYLTQLKLRNPYRNYWHAAPKSMKVYKTPKNSLLPWNNQFSFSYGFDEFSAGDLPQPAKIIFEGELLKMAFNDRMWSAFKNLFKIPEMDPTAASIRTAIQSNYGSPGKIDYVTYNQYLAKYLEEGPKGDIYHDYELEIGNIKYDGNKYLKDYEYAPLLDPLLNKLGKDEIAVKALYTLVLRYTWSGELLPATHNPFKTILKSLGGVGSSDVKKSDKEQKEAEKDNDNIFDDLDKDDGDTINLADYENDALRLDPQGDITPDQIHDPRLTDDMMIADHTALQALANAKYVFNCIGRSANILVQPDDAIKDFRKKLDGMTTEDINDTYDNIIQQTNKSGLTVDDIVLDARMKSNTWLREAERNRKPIYTGPSGHALTYINAYLFALNGQNDVEKIDVKALKQFKLDMNDLPNMHECRLVVLAGLIGVNQHHSYDEVMTGCSGVTHDNEVLKYKDKAGYSDIMNIASDSKFFSQSANSKEQKQLGIKQLGDIFYIAARRIFDNALLAYITACADEQFHLQNLPKGKKNVQPTGNAWLKSVEKWYVKEVQDWFETATGVHLDHDVNQFVQDEILKAAKAKGVITKKFVADFRQQHDATISLNLLKKQKLGPDGYKD